jgi:hypothetical protein
MTAGMWGQPERPVATQQCGCGIPNRSAYWYVVPMHNEQGQRAILRLFLCVEHRVDPRDHSAIFTKMANDSTGWTIESVDCQPAKRHASMADLGYEDEGPALGHRTSTVTGPNRRTALRSIAATRLFDAVESLDRHVVTAEDLDLHLRSESDEEDNLLRHYRGQRHDGRRCSWCKDVDYAIGRSSDR